jgi:hypothetical protein
MTVPGGNSFAVTGAENAKADATNDVTTKPPKHRLCSSLFEPITTTCGIAPLKLFITSSGLITLLLELHFNYCHHKQTMFSIASLSPNLLFLKKPQH